jgi:site-specific recombinase XerD
MNTGHGLVINLKDAVKLFLDAFKQNETYRDATFLAYEGCLQTSPHNLVNYCDNKNLVALQNLTYEFLEGYKLYLLERLGVFSVRKHVTATRQFLAFAYIKGWSSISGNHFHVPKTALKEDHVLQDEVMHELLNQDWGINPFTIKRNHLILYLMLKAGMSPNEICNIQLDGFSINGSTAILSYQGKAGKEKTLVIDEILWGLIQEYMQYRNNYIDSKKIKDNGYLTIGISGNQGTFEVSGIQSLIRNIQKSLRAQGCVWDISKLNAQAIKRTSDAKSLRGHDAYKKVFLVEKRKEVFSKQEIFVQIDSSFIVSSMEKASEIMSSYKKYEGNWWWTITGKSVDSYLLDEGTQNLFNKDGVPIDAQPVTFKNMLPKIVKGGYFSRNKNAVITHKAEVPIPEGYTPEQWKRRHRVTATLKNPPVLQKDVILDPDPMLQIGQKLKKLFYRMDVLKINDVNNLIQEEEFPRNMLRYSGTGRKILMDFYSVFKQNIINIKGPNYDFDFKTSWL